MAERQTHRIDVGKFESYSNWVGMFDALEGLFGGRYMPTNGLYRSHNTIFGLMNRDHAPAFTEVLSWNKEVVGYEITEIIGHSTFPPTPKRSVTSFVFSRERVDATKGFDTELNVRGRLVAAKLDEDALRHLKVAIDKRPIVSNKPHVRL